MAEFSSPIIILKVIVKAVNLADFWRTRLPFETLLLNVLHYNYCSCNSFKCLTVDPVKLV